jgi:hypothetical protein
MPGKESLVGNPRLKIQLEVATATIRDPLSVDS